MTPSPTKGHRFVVGEQVRVARIIDHHVCHFVEHVGTVKMQMEKGIVRSDRRYWVEFSPVVGTTSLAHAFYESELERYTGYTEGSKPPVFSEREIDHQD